MEKTCYQILAVPPGASFVEIQRAFRRQARCYHPDTAAPGMADEVRLQELVAAYRLLSSPAKRARYDARLRSAQTITIGSLLRNFGKFCGARWHGLKTSLHPCASSSRVRSTSVCYRSAPVEVRLRNQSSGPPFSQVLAARRQVKSSCYVLCEDGIIRQKNAVDEGRQGRSLRPRRSNLTVALWSWWGVLLMLMVGVWEVFRR